ncbi:MAG: hypothetical protein RLZZ244_1286 [Verrucomicrobiota bacterium]|jgi:hypothetical protein
MKKLFKVYLGILGIIGLSIISLMKYDQFTAKSRTILHAAKINWLPSTATDVSHTAPGIISFSYELIECTLPENDFIKLAELEKWDIQKKSQFPANIRIKELPKLREVDGFGQINIILNGYKYESRGSNGGGVTVSYDIDLQRMIYDWSSH